MQPKMTYRRHRCVPGVTLVALILTLAAMLGAGTPANAVDPPDVVLDIPNGGACWFDLRVEIWNPHRDRVFREFTDKNGSIVRRLTAGKGSTLAFTNLWTDKKLSLKPNGAVEHITLNPDGSQTWSTTGHNVLILSQTDVPPGPSTTLYVGRVTFTIDTSNVWTLQRTSGESTDICGALS